MFKHFRENSICSTFEVKTREIYDSTRSRLEIDMSHPTYRIDPAITRVQRQRRGRPEGEYPRRRGNIAVNPGKICIARGSSVLAGRHAGGMCGRGRSTLPITPTRPRVITGPETGPLGHVNTVNTGRYLSFSVA